jgi:signal transduction histidine kinase
MQIATVAELSASIAHEINQPLASIAANGQACLTWLAAEPPNVARAQVTGERIIRDANAAAEVVSRIRALFRETAPAMVRSEINEIIVEVLRLMAEEIRDHGVSTDTNLKIGLPGVIVDRVQIQQCLINLLRNAIEAMDGVEGHQRLLSIASRYDGTGILIEIRDTGSGVVNLPLIFDAFFTTKDSGMGMGLAICRSIIDAHGGRLWASPNIGPGTTFSFTLPLRTGAME